MATQGRTAARTAPPKAKTTPAVQKPPSSAWYANSPVANTDVYKVSGNDERGRVQNTILDEKSRFRGQMDPFLDSLGEGFGNAMESGGQDYDALMGGFANIPQVGARYSSYTDPFASYNDFKGMSQTGGYDLPNNDAYKGYKEFGETGGLSSNDIADLRARGVAPIRAAYANAEREVGRQRSLQGGYSPNAVAARAKMAREQSQSGSDALQAVNAGIIAQRNAGRLSGFGGMAGIDQNLIGNRLTGMKGMSDIEANRLNAEMQTNQFNATSGMQADQWNAGNRINALNGAANLYGTTPGMANMFASQLGDAIGRSGQQGSSYIAGETGAQGLDGRYENTKGYVNDALTYAAPFIPNQNKTVTPTGTGMNGGVRNGTYTQGAPPLNNAARTNVGITTPPFVASPSNGNLPSTSNTPYAQGVIPASTRKRVWG